MQIKSGRSEEQWVPFYLKKINIQSVQYTVLLEDDQEGDTDVQKDHGWYVCCFLKQPRGSLRDNPVPENSEY